MEVNVQVFKHEGQVMCGYEVVSGSISSSIALENHFLMRMLKDCHLAFLEPCSFDRQS